MDQQTPFVSESKTAEARSSKRLIAIGAGVLVVIALIAWGIQYWLVGQYFVSTDDAYLAADSTTIAPKINGYVTAVLVRQNQPVRQGQLLLTIDDRDYRVALAGANADMQAAQAAILSDNAQIALQRTKIASAAALVQADQAKLAFARLDARRYASLTGSGASTQQSADQANSNLAIAQATLNADQANAAGAARQVDVLKAQLAQAQASLAQSFARAQQAALDLSHTQIRAPFDGVVGNKTVAVGDYLQTGTQVMAVVPLSQVFVTANYKETQISGMLPGQPVHVLVDGFPDLKVTGTVESISPSSGQEFALLPPDNATGNFTKIVQRVPVKIVLNLNQNLVGKLLPGMSVEPVVDTRPKRQSVAQ
jgi:membrane fusion protein (multidrug efflux system)